MCYILQVFCSIDCIDFTLCTSEGSVTDVLVCSMHQAMNGLCMVEPHTECEQTSTKKFSLSGWRLLSSGQRG